MYATQKELTMRAIEEGSDKPVVGNFSDVEATARNTNDEVLIAFVLAVRDVLVSPAIEQSEEITKDAFSKVVETFEGISDDNPRLRFFFHFHNRITRILDGELRRAVQQKHWGEVYRQCKNVHFTIHEMIHSYK